MATATEGISSYTCVEVYLRSRWSDARLMFATPTKVPSGKKQRFSRDARSLSDALPAGDLRRERQKKLVDDLCGKRLAEDRRPSFMQEEAYPEFIGENFQGPRRELWSRLAG